MQKRETVRDASRILAVIEKFQRMNSADRFYCLLRLAMEDDKVWRQVAKYQNR